MEEPTNANFVEDMADIEARNYQQIKEKGIPIFSCVFTNRIINLMLILI